MEKQKNYLFRHMTSLKVKNGMIKINIIKTNNHPPHISPNITEHSIDTSTIFTETTHKFMSLIVLFNVDRCNFTKLILHLLAKPNYWLQCNMS